MILTSNVRLEYDGDVVILCPFIVTSCWFHTVAYRGGGRGGGMAPGRKPWRGRRPAQLVGAILKDGANFNLAKVAYI